MRANEFFLRCYAERDSDGSWFAMCIDLNLYARAGSYQEVRAELSDIVGQYVREALTEDLEHAEELLKRKAPLAFRLRYHWIRLTGDDGDDSSHIPYNCHLPLAPA